MLILAIVALVLTAAPAHAEPAGPTLRVPAELLDDALRCPDDLHRPVLLVHGTSVTDEENWGWNYVPALRAAGFAPCTVLLPDRSLGDIQVTSEYVVGAIRTVARRAGTRIDVIGLSQGAIQPRWAFKWWPDTRDLVDDYVSMAGTNHGALFGNAACAAGCVPSVWQQRVGSNLLNALNADDETPGDVSYTSVYSLTDEIIQPVPDAPSITGASNVAVQDVCPGRYVGHVQSASDAVYHAVVMDALTHVGPADPSRVDRYVCTQVFMPHVDPVEAVVRTALVYVTAGIVQGTHDKPSEEPPLEDYAREGDA